MRAALRDAALKLAATGVAVFPLVPGGKLPLFPAAHRTGDPLAGHCRGECGRMGHGLYDATVDLAVVAHWWANASGANIGMPTGANSADVLDVDNHGERGTGFPAFRRIRDGGLATGARRLVQTPSGGLHIYFRPAGNRNHVLRRHYVDCRGDGGYVLVPPSVVGGRPYRLLQDRPEANGVLRWDLVRRLLDPPRPAAAFQGPAPGNAMAMAGWLAGVGEGSRNSALFWACCRLAEAGAADLAAMRPLVHAAISTGLTAGEAERTALSALNKIGIAG